MSEETTNEVTNEPAFDESVEDQQADQPSDEKPAEKADETKPDEDKTKGEKDDNPRGNRKRRRTQQYINKLNHENKTAKEEAAYWKGRAEALESKAPAPQRPNRLDYEDEDDYLDAVLDYRDELKSQEPEDKKPEEEIPQPDQVMVEKQGKLIHAGSKLYGDEFTDALSDDNLTISPVMGEYVLDSDVGAEVFMLLADNPERALEIFNMKTNAEQVRALDAIESGIKSSDEGVNPPGDEGQAEYEKTPPKEIPQRKVTKAPPPPNHEKGSAVPDTDEAKLSDAEWFEREKKRVTN